MAKPLDELDIIARGIVRSTEYGLSNNIPVIKDLCRRAYDDHTISSLENNFILKNPKKTVYSSRQSAHLSRKYFHLLHLLYIFAL